MFASRVPGTWGENERTLVLPTDQVFQTDGGKTYLAFLAKNEKQILLDANGKPVSADHRPTGSELYASNYDKVDRMFKKKELLQTEQVQNIRWSDTGKLGGETAVCDSPPTSKLVEQPDFYIYGDCADCMDWHCNISYGLLSQPTDRCGVWI